MDTSLVDQLTALENDLDSAKANLDAVTADRDKYKALVEDPNLTAVLARLVAKAALLLPAPVPAPEHM
jgi:hypothetical protein